MAGQCLSGRMCRVIFKIRSFPTVSRLVLYRITVHAGYLWGYVVHGYTRRYVIAHAVGKSASADFAGGHDASEFVDVDLCGVD